MSRFFRAKFQSQYQSKPPVCISTTTTTTTTTTPPPPANCDISDYFHEYLGFYDGFHQYRDQVLPDCGPGGATLDVVWENASIGLPATWVNNTQMNVLNHAVLFFGQQTVTFKFAGATKCSQTHGGGG